ncbi:MAG: hypothetical protein NW223_24075 [Hyphomicrobiaceae bacterium]|nr:hypothetical protein [Hyphomicrobiaceae bacterium]
MSVRAIMVLGLLLLGSHAALAGPRGACAHLDDDAAIAACAKSLRTNPTAALRDLAEDRRASDDDEDAPVAPRRRLPAADPTEAAIRGALRRLVEDD